MIKKYLNYLIFLLIFSFFVYQFAYQKGENFNVADAVQTSTKIEEEIPSVLICGYNALHTKTINDTTIEYQIEIFKGWQNKYKIKKGNATKYYPKITDPQNRGFGWVSYRSIEKKDTIIAVFAYDSAGIFVTGQFAIKSKTSPFECNDFWKK